MKGEWVGGDGSAVRGVFVCVQEMVSSPLSRKSRWYPIKVLKSDGTEVSCVRGLGEGGCEGCEWCGAMCVVVQRVLGVQRVHGVGRLWVGCAGCAW